MKSTKISIDFIHMHYKLNFFFCKLIESINIIFFYIKIRENTEYRKRKKKRGKFLEKLELEFFFNIKFKYV